MKKIFGKLFVMPLAAISIFMVLFLTGCGDNDMAKNVTDAVKKSVEAEVAKKGDEIKKQIDQVINPGSGQSEQENGQPAGNAGKEESEKGSGGESGEDKD